MPRLLRQISRATPSPRPVAGRFARFAHNAPTDDAEQEPNSPSGSELSSPPFSPESDEDVSSRKRKRPTKSFTIQATEVRRSPRKALKLEQSSTPARKPKRQPAKQMKSEDGDIKVEPPAGWEEMYSVTTELRKRHLAPVDTMGCESLAEDHRPPLERRLQTLVALMLSSQTKDTVTAVAMKNLQQNLPGGFTLASLLAVDQEHLNQLIAKVGFHNNKARFIKQTAAILQEKFAGDIPDTIEGLTSLPGVGPKMAYLTMSAAWGRDEGIGVDVHVHRITNLWGWHKTSTPEQTRAALEAWLPREKWHDINHLLVGLGQTICLPIGRRCGECDLSARKICPSAVAGSPAKRRVKKEIKIEVKQELDDENIAPTKELEVAFEADDVADVVKIKSEDLGEVKTIETTNIGRVPDIEGLGAGRARRLAKAVSTL